MNTVVTVFGRVKNSQLQAFEWEKRLYAARFVSVEDSASVSGDSSMQRKRLIVRIFGEKPIVNVGDMIVVGEAEGNTPPADASVINVVRRNDRGSALMRHTKIIAEG